MKSVIRVFLLAFLAAGIASCSLFDVEFDTSFEGDLAIEVEEPAIKSAVEAFPFNASVIINVLDDEDVYEYQDKINDFIVSGVTATVTWINTDGVEFLAGSAFTITNGTRTVTWTLPVNVPIVEGTSINLEDLGDVYKTISAILADMKPITMTATGECNKAPVSAVVRLGIDTKVVANPL
jgi:hypothetical protein